MDWNQIRNEYETSNLTLKTLAEKHGVKDSTLRSRKNREKWQRNDATQRKKNVATKKENVATPKKDAPLKKQPRKRSGNPNPQNQFSHRNNPKLLHGLRSKFLHQEQIEIMDAMSEMSIADQLWFQIEIKFSAIVRMQKIMWVEDANDHLKVESGSSWGDGGSESFKVSFAYERYESYIKAQARAMAEFRNLTKQFDELAHSEDERRLKLDQMRLNIEKTKAEVDNITSVDDDQPIEILIKRKER